MISHNALKHLAALNNAIRRMKWTAAYRAADQLAEVEQVEAKPGETFEMPPRCSVT